MALRVLLRNLCGGLSKVQTAPFVVCACQKSGWIKQGRPYCTEYNLYDPPYIRKKIDIPVHDTLLVRMRGYDFAMLESYAKHVHKMAETLGLESLMWPVPARSTKVTTFKPFSIKVEHEYHFSVYERTLEVQDLKSTMAPIFLEVLQQSLPQGVEFTVTEPDPEEEEFRYVPDLMLKDLQEQMDEINRAIEDRKKK